MYSVDGKRRDDRMDGVGRRLCRPSASSAVSERRSGNEGMVVVSALKAARCVVDRDSLGKGETRYRS